MRRFVDGDIIWIEPFRAAGFPPVKDLVVDRSAFDQIIEAGGYIVVRTGSAPEANSLPVPKHDADLAMEAAACIGCGGLRGGLPKLLRDVVRVGQSLAPRSFAARPGGTRQSSCPDGSEDG
jgi:hypothetical protein